LYLVKTAIGGVVIFVAMKLSNYLSLAEVTRSDTAKRKGISNEPTAEHLENMKTIAVEVFDKVREYFGVPIFVSSGYRSAALNKAIGGSSTSDHNLGRALDLDQDGHGNGVTNADVFKFIKDNLEFDQLIWEFGTDKNPDWVHVGYRKGANRKQILKAVREGGKTKYVPYK
jgi:zinc D-Ala-D-Ala carboxypeptidase